MNRVAAVHLDQCTNSLPYKQSDAAAAKRVCALVFRCTGAIL